MVLNTRKRLAFLFSQRLLNLHSTASTQRHIICTVLADRKAYSFLNINLCIVFYANVVHELLRTPNKHNIIRAEFGLSHACSRCVVDLQHEPFLLFSGFNYLLWPVEIDVIYAEFLLTLSTVAFIHFKFKESEMGLLFCVT